MDSELLARTELFFRAYQHIVLPVHVALVESMCRSSAPPIDLATVLEDIGQVYVALANDLNRELGRRGRLGEEPEPDDASEARIDRYVAELLAKAGQIRFVDGKRLDGKEALAAFPAVADAIKAALHVAHAHLSSAKAAVAAN